MSGPFGGDRYPLDHGRCENSARKRRTWSIHRCRKVLASRAGSLGPVTCIGRGGRGVRVGGQGGSHARIAASAVVVALLTMLALVVVPLPASSTVPTFTGVAAGAAHSCAIRTGTVWCWGLNDSGQLGTETADDVAASP